MAAKKTAQELDSKASPEMMEGGKKERVTKKDRKKRMEMMW